MLHFVLESAIYKDGVVMSKFNLSGKTALITGAAGLLGGEHATALLENGASVILTDINEEALQKTRNSLIEYLFQLKLMQFFQKDNIFKAKTLSQNI